MPRAAPVCACGAPLRRLLADTGAHYDQPYLLYRCEVCDLISPDPLPSETEVRATYDGYGRYASSAELTRDVERKRVQARRLVLRLERQLGARFRGARLLEVGCAAGALLLNLAEERALDVHGLEPDRVNAAVARERLGERVHVGTLEDVRYDEQSFDVVYADQVLEHVLDPARFLLECRRVLAPGGMLMVATPNFAGLSARLLGLGWKELIPHQHIRMFTPRALRFYLERAQLLRTRVATQGLYPIRRRDERDLLPLRRGGWPERLLSKALGVAGLGDGLGASAFRSIAQ
ncbi:MAG: class I SAM-dependent methyltransferase [Polyangiaceae bacterium]